MTGLSRFGYDRSKPFSSKIRYYDVNNPVEEVKVPEYYVIPQGWKEVIERLQLNGVTLLPLASDTTLEVEVDYLDEYSSQNQPYT